MLEPYSLPDYVYYAMLVLVAVSCYLLIAEIPMFALKFKTWGWRGNEIKYIFVLTSIVLIAVFGILGIAAVIGWYVVLSLVSKRS